MNPPVVTNPVAIAPPPGLPPGVSGFPSTSGGNGGSFALNADNGDWLNSLQPTAIGLVGFGNPISFPSLTFKEAQTNALAIHTFPNLDGAKVENMGRNPAKFHVRAMLTNSIFPGVNETWKPGSLFPSVFQSLIAVLFNTTADKQFSHPIYGQVVVQVESWTYELNTKGPRDGAIVDMVLIETIQKTTLAQQIPTSGSGLLSAANALDSAIAATLGTLSPPGMSLSGFFSTIANTIQSVTSIPQSVVSSIGAKISSITTSAESIAAAVVNAPANLVTQTQTAIQQTKASVANSPLQTALVNYSTTFNLQNKYNTHYTQATYLAMEALVSLNNTPSQNVFQLIDKVMKAITTLHQHYIEQNDSRVAPVIEGLRKYLLQLQQVQSALSQNSTSQSLLVELYINPVNMSWAQIARHLKNSIDDLLGLNSGLITDLWVPAFSTIKYYQTK